MRTILKFRWLITSLLLVITVVSVFISPSLTDIAGEQDGFQLPSDMSSQIAGDVLESQGESGETISIVLEWDDPLTGQQEEELAQYIEDIQNEELVSHVSSVTDPLESENTREQLVSEDENVVLIPIGIDGGSDESIAASEDIEELTAPEGTDLYITGNSIISHEIDEQTQEGLERTEVITVLLILTLLVLVFRSLVAPLIPLFSVAIAFLLSQSVVGFLGEWFGFPVTTYTQVFLVAVLFGIGTDYCILLLSRYREELASGKDTHEAIIHTYKTAGKTLFFSGLAVFVGFAALGFAEFAMYQATVSVAIGVFILVLVLYLLLPFFMAVLKEKMFWPSKKPASHSHNKLWKQLGRLSIFRPVLSLLLVAAITLPFILTYDNNTSYNNTDEISGGTQSLDGLEVIADAFGEGQALPLEIIIDGEDNLINEETMAYTEALSAAIAESDDVSEVRSVTRPTGSIIDELYVDNQMEAVSEGLAEARDGLTDIEEGLSDADSGFDETGSAASDIEAGLGELENGLSELDAGFVEVNSGLNELTSSIGEVQSGAEELEAGLESVEAGLPEGQEAAGGSLDEPVAALNQINEQLAAIPAQLQQAQSPEEISAIAEQTAALQAALAEVEAGLSEGNEQLTAQQEEASGQLDVLSEGIGELTAGAVELSAALSEIQSGLEEVTAANEQLAEGTAELQEGAGTLEEGAGGLASGIEQLQEGVAQANSGVGEVNTGLEEAETFTEDISEASYVRGTGVFVPEAFLTNDDFQESLDTYIFDSEEGMTMSVSLAADPYSLEAIEATEDIKQLVSQQVQGTPFEDASISYSGVSSSNADLEEISSADFTHTITIILIGLFVVLTILLRSLFKPIVILGALLLTYYTSMGITEMIFVNGLGYPGIMWPVHFFTFIMLIALGVDYSIFLFDRYQEEADLGVREGMMQAMIKMGTVIITAVIILCGTFGAMIPSGVLTLMQVGTGVVTGLLLFGLIILPLLVTAIISMEEPKKLKSKKE